MRMRGPLMFLIGALAGGGAVYVYTAPPEIIFPHAITAPETVRVLVAKRALFSGAMVTAEDLQWAEWPVAATPADAFTSTEALFGKDGAQRRFVLQPINAGEPILAERISRPENSPPAPVTLGEGMRAVTIRVDREGVDGAVMAGDWVDILMTKVSEGRSVTSVILQDVVVLFGDRQADPVPEPPRPATEVTLAVTMREAQLLALAQQAGKLSPVLPGRPDNSHDPDLGPYPDRLMPPVYRRRPDFYAPPGEQVR